MTQQTNGGPTAGEPATAGAPSADQIAAYETVLSALLDIRTTDELRDVFARRPTQDAAAEFVAALRPTRARGQPDSFALSWAIEVVIARERQAAGHDISEMFDDPGYHTPPTPELEEAFNAMWAVRA